MAYVDNSGINLGSNFTYKSHNPLDNRFVAARADDLADILSTGSYPGLLVYILEGTSHNGKSLKGGLYFVSSSGDISHVTTADGELCDTLGNTLASQISALSKRIDDLSGGATDSLAELKKDIGDVADDLADEVKARSTLEEEFDTHVQTYNNFTKDVSDWQTDHDTEYAEFKAAYKEDTSNLAKATQAVADDLSEYEESNNQAVSAISTTIGADDTSGLRKRIATNESDIDALQQSLSELDGSVSEQLTKHTNQFAATEDSVLKQYIIELQKCLTWNKFGSEETESVTTEDIQAQ